jgi:dTDP-4-amino-4,6-dideoxygalactose transaminase
MRGDGMIGPEAAEVPAGGQAAAAERAAGFLPVYRPLLPTAEALLPYLRQIDAARFYTNRGPLVWQLEQRLAGLLGQEGHAVRTAASGTLALELAILAHAGRATPDRPLALLPSFTFAATAQAAERCGYRPVFVDVDPATWTLDAAALAHHPLRARAGLAVAVAPYGRLPDTAALAALQAETGIPVAVDAAAAFETLLDAPHALTPALPLALSLHATKGFSTGEGGAVLWPCREGQARVVQIANFGFRTGREAETVGLNGKLSEFHAAVGLAMLEGLAARREAQAAVVAAWVAQAACRRLPGRLHLSPRISPAYALLETPDAATCRHAEAALAEQGIETRRWYGRGVHRQPYFTPPAPAADPLRDPTPCPTPDPLPVTAALCDRLLGLPTAPDQTAAEIARVLDALAAVAEGAAA